jgi:hypothetical protein
MGQGMDVGQVEDDAMMGRVRNEVSSFLEFATSLVNIKNRILTFKLLRAIKRGEAVKTSYCGWELVGYWLRWAMAKVRSFERSN